MSHAPVSIENLSRLIVFFCSFVYLLVEFLGMLRAVHADEEDPDLMEAKIRRAFDQIDKNHDRELDKEEFKAAVALLGRSLTESQIDTLFNEIDVDASGKIDFPEFSSRLMNEWRGRPLS
uniref:EF-hand domain-containing protein n=1 Tax=Compsopogon caeruleus TaxID=31354 RepID=A0A7S1TC57_9RHOD|mmetsp:Transcript_17165/g.35681  ORF Transcript_17165/g.35681 Transcript_17165/m.35681 type:complete len:120 (+) Transcript_17165:443-802(+)